MTNKSVSKHSIEINGLNARKAGWVVLNDKRYYFKSARQSLESFNAELYRFALGSDVITETLPVVDDNGQVVGVLSEEIKNGCEVTSASGAYPELRPMTVDVRLTLGVGHICAALHVLDEQDGNTTNIFVREVRTGTDVERFRLALIDFEYSLGSALTHAMRPITNPREFDFPVLMLPAGASIAGGVNGSLAASPAFKAQTFFTYLIFSLLESEVIASLAEEHFHADLEIKELAISRSNKFVGEHLRRLLLQNVNFIQWLRTNKDTIEMAVVTHVTAYNAYKGYELVSVANIKQIFNGMCDSAFAAKLPEETKKTVERTNSAPEVSEKKPGFFKRHWKAIVATTMTAAMAGIGLGVAAGLVAAVPSFGLGFLAIPVLFAIGAVVGFVAGVCGGLVREALQVNTPKISAKTSKPDHDSRPTAMTQALVDKRLGHGCNTRANILDDSAQKESVVGSSFSEAGRCNSQFISRAGFGNR